MQTDYGGEDKMDNLLPRLPFADWIDDGVEWLVRYFWACF